MNWQEACFILGVQQTATQEEIHDQYMYKVQLLHPDWNANKPAPIKKKAEDELKLVNAAYNILKDTGNRQKSEAPKLAVSLRKIRFKDLELGQKKTASIEVKSVSGAYTKIWVDDAPASWLKITDIKSLTADALPLKVTLEAAGSGEPHKHYSCNLEIRLENEQTGLKDTVVVKVELWMKAEPGILKVDNKTMLKFKMVKPGSVQRKTFVVRNGGSGFLQGHIFTTRSWMNVTPNWINIPPSKRAVFTITLASEALRRGLNDKAFINIITNGGSQRVPVEVSVAPIVLSQLYSFVLYFTTICLLVISPKIFDPANLGVKYMQNPTFWVMVSAYAIFVIGSIYRLFFHKEKPAGPTDL
jgi:hypothetical protein